MKENIKHLHERIEHFHSLIAYMSERGQKYYLEKDWFDNPTLISIEDAKKEVELAKKKLELLSKRSVMKCILQLLHRFIFEKRRNTQMESILESLKQEKDHLEKIIKVVSSGGKFLRLPYQKKSRSISENLKLISQNLDKLSEQVQQTTNQHS